MLILNHNYRLPTCLLPILTQRAQSNVNKPTLTNPQRELSRAIVARFRTWQKKNIHVWKVSEKGHQCIKAASLYDTFKIQHPSFNILIIIITIIIIITFTSTAPFSLLSNGALQQQLL